MKIGKLKQLPESYDPLRLSLAQPAHDTEIAALNVEHSVQVLSQWERTEEAGKFLPTRINFRQLETWAKNQIAAHQTAAPDRMDVEDGANVTDNDDIYEQQAQEPHPNDRTGEREATSKRPRTEKELTPSGPSRV